VVYFNLPQQAANEESYMSLTIFTIGHSTRSFDEFLAIIKTFHIEMVADVRTIPRSRHNPQFNRESLKAGLEAHEIGYVHMEGLGGLRHTIVNSINHGWENLSFRGYADYMQTPEFRNSLEQFIHMAKEKVTTIMCAEAVPWRCHRSLIGDALLIRGLRVEDILSDRLSKLHQLTPWARVDGYNITYPGEA
jgi:uncharacterized protein (DUF488 family)